MNKRAILRAAPMVMVGFLVIGLFSLTSLVVAVRGRSLI